VVGCRGPFCERFSFASAKAPPMVSADAAVILQMHLILN